MDRLLTQLESGPNETGITELRMHWDTLEHEQPKGIMDIGVENVTLNQVEQKQANKPRASHCPCAAGVQRVVINGG